MDRTPEQIIRIRGYIVIAAIFFAFVAKSFFGGFFSWLFTYTLLTTVADLLMVHRFELLLDAHSHDTSTTEASSTNPLEPEQMEDVVNRALQHAQTPEHDLEERRKHSTFVEKFGIRASTLNKYFETQASVRLWCFGIAALHALVGYLVYLDYQSMFIEIYIALRLGCFAYGIVVRTIRSARA